jgi:hypothetical protein
VAVAVLEEALLEVDLAVVAEASAVVSVVEDSLAAEAAEVGSFLKNLRCFADSISLLAKINIQKLSLKTLYAFTKNQICSQSLAIFSPARGRSYC